MTRLTTCTPPQDFAKDSVSLTLSNNDGGSEVLNLAVPEYSGVLLDCLQGEPMPWFKASSTLEYSGVLLDCLQGEPMPWFKASSSTLEYSGPGVLLDCLQGEPMPWFKASSSTLEYSAVLLDCLQGKLIPPSLPCLIQSLCLFACLQLSTRNKFER